MRVLLNPRAGSGSAAKRVSPLLAELRRHGLAPDVVETRGPLDAARLVREAGAEGVDCLAVIGGDGTLNEVAQAYVDEAGNAVSGPTLALVPGGTGGDFRKTFDLSDRPMDAARRLLQAPTRAIDLGVVRLRGPRGEPVSRAFINVLSFGLGGHTDRIVNANPKWLGGRAGFLLGALRALVSYRSAWVTVHVDGHPCLEAPILNVAVANGQFFGGGMHIAPAADPADGKFDVVALYDLTRVQGIALAHKIYRGTHPGSPGVRVAQGMIVEAEPAQKSAEVLIDLDGETPGRLPLRAEVLPGAVSLRI